jgi:hypothetical protein
VTRRNEPAEIVGIPTGSNHNIIYKGDNPMTKSTITKARRVCQVKGCMANHKGYGYCEKHLRRVKKHGSVVRTMYDPNTFEFKDNVCLSDRVV